MSERYTFDPDCSQEEQCECSMEECPAGEYVSTEDYEKLQAQLADKTRRFDQCSKNYKELEQSQNDGWDAYKELRKEVAEKKYPNLTNTIILNGDK